MSKRCLMLRAGCGFLQSIVRNLSKSPNPRHRLAFGLVGTAAPTATIRIMKSLCSLLPLLFVSAALAQSPSSPGADVGPVAFLAGNGCYVSGAKEQVEGSSEGGALRYNCEGKKVGSRQTFYVRDVNGGDLADGDTVQILIKSKGQDTPPEALRYMKEADGFLSRGFHPQDFQLKKQGDLYLLVHQNPKAVNEPPTYLQATENPQDFLKFGTDESSALKFGIQPVAK